MTLWRAVIAAGVATSLTGCAVFQRPTAAWPWGDYPCSLAAAENTTGACKDDEDRALAMFIKSSEFCRAVHNRYEAGANQAGLAQSAVSVIGTAAGIVAVATTGTASKAFSAMSGSTNAMQLAMSNALSATAELKRQSAVGAAASEWGGTFRNAPNFKTKQIVAIEMANQCWLASAKAEQQVLQAISAPVSPPPPPPSPAALAAQSAQTAQAAAQAASQTAAQAAAQASEAAKAAEVAKVAEAEKAAEASKIAEAAKAAAAAAAKANQVTAPAPPSVAPRQ